ncbi:MAG: helix-turn-helix domain-containing protein [Pirellulaceae bacterium]|nr:helix-turn-helix domain-containing protein [Pirellulaceae bacterium]
MSALYNPIVQSVRTLVELFQPRERKGRMEPTIFDSREHFVDELLTTRQVAAELQVSESSVKRWCDSGLIRFLRTAGGHRRIERSQLKEFVTSTNYRSFDKATKGGASQMVFEAPETYRTITRDDIIRRFQMALVAGDETACKELIDQWHQRFQGIAQLGDLLIAGAMETVGKLWECGRAEIFEERRSCEICMRLLADLRSKVPDLAPGAPRAIGGTIAGDHYTLANYLVELVLREAGWNATSLGANLPLDTLLAAVRREKPQLLWLSISHVGDAETFIAHYNQFYSQLPADLVVTVGGRALTDAIRPRIGFSAHCDNLEQLSALAHAVFRSR